MVYSTRRFVLCLTLCYFVLVFSSPFNIAITSLGEGRANLSVFVYLFDSRLFGFVCFLFLLVSGKGCGLWLSHSLDFSLTFFVQGRDTPNPAVAPIPHLSIYNCAPSAQTGITSTCGRTTVPCPSWVRILSLLHTNCTEGRTPKRLKSACASTQSDQSTHCPHEEIFHPWLSKMRPVKILIRLCACAVWPESSRSALVRR